MKVRNFKVLARKIVGNIKRNIYAYSICLCVAIGVTMVVVTILSTSSSATTHNLNTNQTQNVQEKLPDYFDEQSEPADAGPTDADPVIPVNDPTIIVMKAPLKTYSLGMTFCNNSLIYSKTLKQWQTHEGVDFLAENGAGVCCVLDGIVEEVGKDILDGWYAVIRHSDGLKTVYKSLSENLEVEQGQTLKAGDVIGYVSTTSIIEQLEGSHLHFEVIENDEKVNPLTYLSSETK